LSVESKRVPPNHLKIYEAIQRYYEWALSQKPEGFPQVLEALKHEAGIEPECGQVWTILGRLYGRIYSLEFPGFENTLGKAVTYAEKGVQLNPDNQQAKGRHGIYPYVMQRNSSSAFRA
jgi:adenylate cyclase